MSKYLFCSTCGYTIPFDESELKEMLGIDALKKLYWGKLKLGCCNDEWLNTREEEVK